MEIFWIILTGAVLLGGFAIYATMFSNPEVAGEGFLSTYLKNFGVDPKTVPKALLDKMQARASTSASVAAGADPSVASQRPKWNVEYQEFLKVEAELLARYLKNPESLANFSGSERYVDEYKEHGL